MQNKTDPPTHLRKLYKPYTSNNEVVVILYQVLRFPSIPLSSPPSPSAVSSNRTRFRKLKGFQPDGASKPLNPCKSDKQASSCSSASASPPLSASRANLSVATRLTNATVEWK